MFRVSFRSHGRHRGRGRAHSLIMGVRVGAVLLAAVGVALVVAPDRGSAVTTAPVTYAPAVSPQQAAPPMVAHPEWAPILLIVDPIDDATWQVTRAANEWNTATGCRLFITRGDGHSTYDTATVHESRALYGGKPMHGVTTIGGPVAQVELNPQFGVDWRVSLHELGHVVGLPHDDDPAGIMNVGVRHGVQVAATVDRPDAAEVAKVRQLQAGRCG